jgi:hypothetical protein
MLKGETKLTHKITLGGTQKNKYCTHHFLTSNEKNALQQQKIKINGALTNFGFKG